MDKPKTYFVYEVQGYHSRAEDGKLLDVTTVSVVADTEEEAIEKAKGLVKKELYRVSLVTECVLKKE